MGSPRTLNDVLMSTAQPVRSSKAVRICVELGVALGVHGLEAGRVVDVGDGGQVGADLVDPLPQVVGRLVGRRPSAPRGRRPRSACTATGPCGRSTSATRSSSTAGAKGRNDSRYLIFRFSTDCISGDRGSPMIERWPRARGPNSMRPWNRPTTSPRATSSATAAAPLAGVDPPVGVALLVEPGRDLVGGPRRAEEGARACRRAGRACARGRATWCQPQRAAPSAPPASPGRGLDPEVVERALPQQPAVGHAVQGHAAGQAPPGARR